MKSLGVLAVLVIVVIVAGGLTAGLANLDFAIIQSTSPDASVFEATPGQSAAFFLMAGFIVFNVLGVGLTLAGIFWFLNRQITRAQVEEES